MRSVGPAWNATDNEHGKLEDYQVLSIENLWHVLLTPMVFRGLLLTILHRHRLFKIYQRIQ